MIRDKGNLKAGNSYTLSENKATPLLTEGFCVRLKEKPNFSDIAPELTPVENTENLTPEIANNSEAAPKRKK